MDRLAIIYIHHCVAASVAYVLNGLLFVLVWNCTRTNMGKYNCLLMSYTIFNTAYPTIQLLAAPMVFAHGRSYVLVSTTSLIQDYAVCYFLIIVYCTFYCQSLLLMMFQFIYQYLAVCHIRTLQILHSRRALALILSFYFCLTVAWGFVVHSTMRLSPTDVALQDDYFRRRYDISVIDLPSVGASFEALILNKGEINWISYYGIAFLNTIMTATCVVIVYCAMRIQAQLKVMKSSEEGATIHQELYRALLVQTFFSLILRYLPCFVIYATAIFGLSVDLEFTALLVALEPVFGPIWVVYFVSDYRLAISSLIVLHSATPTRSTSYTTHLHPNEHI